MYKAYQKPKRKMKNKNKTQELTIQIAQDVNRLSSPHFHFLVVVVSGKDHRHTTFPCISARHHKVPFLRQP